MPRYRRDPIKPENPQILRVRVVRSMRISPSFVRVTLGGDDLARFTPMGHDQWFRLFLPQAHQSEPLLPTSAGPGWWPQLLMTSASHRPHVRNYTVRAFREAPFELDVDFAIHSDAGPASSWALTARPGDPAGILDEGVMWNPRPTTERVLIVADDSGVAAAAGIAAGLDAGATGDIVLEVEHADDAQLLSVPSGVRVHWVVRDEQQAAGEARSRQRAEQLAADGALAEPEHARGAAVTLERPHVGQAALERAVQVFDERSRELGDLEVAAFAVGEQQLATGLRRALVSRGVPKTHITFCGYWRRGRDNSF
ncbi:siderophore-interacting protein [Microbacterium sp. STN6]|uniref:siderophore-interacting protein n=1 Tax=Microbacterium sp. STN6 TaxID=2995588 RepID=UPI002260A737|nr:siderophore-interacting protein [Microbacterium sp. STN6]MCX7523007.1 siderophore-interacting protein [Microbacterium sp. STN6]